MKIEFLIFGVATAFSDCKGPRKHFKIGKLATVQCSHETKSCDINCEFGVKVSTQVNFWKTHPIAVFRFLGMTQSISGKLIHTNFSKRDSHAICKDEFTRNQLGS